MFDVVDIRMSSRRSMVKDKDFWVRFLVKSMRVRKGIQPVENTLKALCRWFV